MLLKKCNLAFLQIMVFWLISPLCGWAGPSAGAELQPEIVLGMSTALSGPTAELGQQMRDGVLAALERCNRSGGIQGRMLRLLSYDDGYEPFRTAPNMRRLAQQDQVVAVVGNVGTPTAIAAVPIARSQKVLFYAPFSGAGLLRKNPPERYVINYRASYAEEISAMVDALILHAGLQPEDIAFFTQRDAYGDAGYVGGFAALQRHGLQNKRKILHVRYARNTLAVEGALADLLVARRPPKAVIMVGTYAPCAKFIQLARRHGLKSLFLNVSFVGSHALLRKLGQDAEGVIITQVVPPLQNNDLLLVRDYVRDQELWNPSRAPNLVGLEGYIATRILLRAMHNLAGPITRESIIDALEQLGAFDMGLRQPLALSPESHQASNTVWPTLLANGRIEPFAWKELTKMVRELGMP